MANENFNVLTGRWSSSSGQDLGSGPRPSTDTAYYASPTVSRVRQVPVYQTVFDAEAFGKYAEQRAKTFQTEFETEKSQKELGLKAGLAKKEKYFGAREKIKRNIEAGSPVQNLITKFQKKRETKFAGQQQREVDTFNKGIQDLFTQRKAVVEQEIESKKSSFQKKVLIGYDTMIDAEINPFYSEKVELKLKNQMDTQLDNYLSGKLGYKSTKVGKYPEGTDIYDWQKNPATGGIVYIPKDVKFDEKGMGVRYTPGEVRLTSGENFFVPTELSKSAGEYLQNVSLSISSDYYNYQLQKQKDIDILEKQNYDIKQLRAISDAEPLTIKDLANIGGVYARAAQPTDNFALTAGEASLLKKMNREYLTDLKKSKEIDEFRKKELIKQGGGAAVGVNEFFGVYSTRAQGIKEQMIPFEIGFYAMSQKEEQLFFNEKWGKLISNSEFTGSEAQYEQYLRELQSLNISSSGRATKFSSKLINEYGVISPEKAAALQAEQQAELEKAYSFDIGRIGVEAGISAGIGGGIGLATGGPLGAAAGAGTFAGLTFLGEGVRSLTYGGLSSFESYFGKSNVEQTYFPVPSLGKFFSQAEAVYYGQRDLIGRTSPINYFGQSNRPFTDYLVQQSYFDYGTKENIADFAGIMTFFGATKIAEKTTGQLASSTFARTYNWATGVKQIEFKGLPLLTKITQKEAFVFTPTWKGDPLLGPTNEKALREVLGIGSKTPIRIANITNQYAGFNPQVGKKILATQNVGVNGKGASKKPWGTPQYDPLYFYPSTSEEFYLANRQFGAGLQKGKVAYGKTPVGWRQPKVFAQFADEVIYGPEEFNVSFKKLQKLYQTGTKAQKAEALGEATRLYSTKVFSGKAVEPVENYIKKILEGQVSVQKQGFVLNTTQPQRGSVLNYKKYFGRMYFYDELALPGKKTLEQYKNADNVLGAVFKKTNLPKNLEKAYQFLGFGRDYKQVYGFGVTLSVPRGRPAKESKILRRETARYLEYDKKTKEFLLYQERSGQFGTGGGAIDPYYNPTYYKGSKINMVGGRVLLSNAKATVSKESMEELGVKFIFKKRLSVGAIKGEPYLATQGQYFQDFTKKVFLVKGKVPKLKLEGFKIKKAGGVDVGEILGSKKYTLEQALSASDKEVSVFTKRILLKASKAMEKEKNTGFVKNTKDFLKSVTPAKAPKGVSAGPVYDEYYYGRTAIQTPEKFLAGSITSKVSEKYYYKESKYTQYKIPLNNSPKNLTKNLEKSYQKQVSKIYFASNYQNYPLENYVSKSYSNYYPSKPTVNISTNYYPREPDPYKPTPPPYKGPEYYPRPTGDYNPKFPPYDPTTYTPPSYPYPKLNKTSVPISRKKEIYKAEKQIKKAFISQPKIKRYQKIANLGNIILPIKTDWLKAIKYWEKKPKIKSIGLLPSKRKGLKQTSKLLGFNFERLF